MALEGDALLDRRRLKRRLAAWRAAAVLGFVGLALLLLNLAGAPVLPGFAGGDHVARVHIDGIIAEDPWRDERLAALAEDASAKAVVVRIASPGGTTYGGEALYLSLRRIAGSKPVVAVIGTVGASGGYMAALATDRIFAGESSITGSIGVLFQATEFSDLMSKLGVSAEAIKSGSLKAEPSLIKPLSEGGRAMLQSMVDETHRWFVGLVAERRQMTVDRASAVADGRVYIGRTAVAERLVDELGGEREARAWLASERGVDADLPMVDVDWSPPGGGWRDLLTGLFGKAVFSERLILDGLVSVWHPER